MRFYADLHVHSHYSRATSKLSNLAGLSAWAMLKGIQVVGTGDFTHPAWLKYLRQELVEAEPGLFRLREPKIPSVFSEGDWVSSKTRFILSSEVSCIYKQGGRTRKVHLNLYVPDIESAERISQKLSEIGNIEMDGRPIIGISARDLLEVLLDNVPKGFMVPAHIWTPWFSLLGAKSGFESIEECFEDLSEHVFALETGLSADPEMIRRVSALDRFTLVSSSDCHSPSKLGREANIFNTGLDYSRILDALKEPVTGFEGTIEYFPEEGKYHWDGHRKCGIRVNPSAPDVVETLCPVCQKPLTTGVLHRVIDLADREHPIYPKGQDRFFRLLPLVDILSELLQVGPQSKTVSREYQRTVSMFGSEFHLLMDTDPQEITVRHSSLLSEAITRVRAGEIAISPGFDGEFGKVRIFKENEL